MANGEKWQHQRSATRHSFTHESLKAMVPVMLDCIHIFTSTLNGLIEADEKHKLVLGVVSQTQQLVGEIVIRVLFSQKESETKLDDQPLS